MAHWLLKEEPAHYGWADLVRDGRTEWDGVHNALALRNLKAMRVGDRAVYYHTGAERSCVGIVEVDSAPRPDPRDRRGSWTVGVRPVRALHRSIPLAEVKADPALAGFDLVRVGRLTVMPVSDDHWTRLIAHEDSTARVPSGPTGGRRGRARRASPRRRRAGARRRR